MPPNIGTFSRVALVLILHVATTQSLGDEPHQVQAGQQQHLSAVVDPFDLEEIGCVKRNASCDARSGGVTYLDDYCKDDKRAKDASCRCRAGLPWFRMTSNDDLTWQSQCLMFCLSKGLDVMGVLREGGHKGGFECRCGASAHHAIWKRRRGGDGGDRGLAAYTRASKGVTPWPCVLNEVTLFRVAWTIPDGSDMEALDVQDLRDHLIDVNAQELAYIDEVLTGKEHDEEDAPDAAKAEVKVPPVPVKRPKAKVKAAAVHSAAKPKKKDPHAHAVKGFRAMVNAHAARKRAKATTTTAPAPAKIDAAAAVAKRDMESVGEHKPKPHLTTKDVLEEAKRELAKEDRHAGASMDEEQAKQELQRTSAALAESTMASASPRFKATVVSVRSTQATRKRKTPQKQQKQQQQLLEPAADKSKVKEAATANGLRDCSAPGGCGSLLPFLENRMHAADFDDAHGDVAVRAHEDWEKVAVVEYFFGTAIDDNRKRVFQEACTRWARHTCVRLVEKADASQFSHAGVGLDIGKRDDGTCWSQTRKRSSSFTQQGAVRINLGWCSDMIHVGSIMHEIGHALGMVHTQKRPDAGQDWTDPSGHKHAAKLALNEENIPAEMRSQYTAEAKVYVGDSRNGFAKYDFGSIEHYPIHKGNFRTVPDGAFDSLVGNRRAPTSLDIAQINAMYLCQPAGHVEPVRRVSMSIGETWMNSDGECRKILPRGADSDSSGNKVVCDDMSDACWRRLRVVEDEKAKKHAAAGSEAEATISTARVPCSEEEKSYKAEAAGAGGTGKDSAGMSATLKNVVIGGIVTVVAITVLCVGYFAMSEGGPI